MEKPFLSGNLKLNEDALKKIFLYNLNQIHPILLQLKNILPELAKATNFGDLQNVVDEFLLEVKSQTIRVDEIFKQLNEIPTERYSYTTKQLLQTLEHKHEYEQMDNLSKDLSLVFHLQKVVLIIKNYFHILKSIANSLNSLNIKQNLQYSYDECEDNQIMFTLLAKEYMESSINTFLR